MAVTRLKWGWYSKHIGEVQPEVFDTADKALADMEARQGEGVSLERLHEIGFKLTLVEVTYKPLMIMERAT